MTVVNETKGTPMSPPVTCADKLRDLHAKGDAEIPGGWMTAYSRIGKAIHPALPEIATVIEAAEQFIGTMGRHHSRLYNREVASGFTAASGDSARELDDALAALFARLDGAS